MGFLKKERLDGRKCCIPYSGGGDVGRGILRHRAKVIPLARSERIRSMTMQVEFLDLGGRNMSWCSPASSLESVSSVSF